MMPSTGQALTYDPQTYAARREPYVIFSAKMIAATVIFLLACALFVGGIQTKNTDAARLAGWAMAPVIWLVASAAKTHKHIKPQDRMSSDLSRARKGARVCMYVFVATVTLAVASASWGWVATRDTRAKVQERERIFAEGKQLFVDKKKAEENLGRILQRRPTVFYEFQMQTDELQSVLDENEPLLEKRVALLKQLRPLYTEPDAISLVNLLLKGAEQDARAYEYWREEINCSHGLSKASRDQQKRFNELCVVPTNEKLAVVFNDQAKLLQVLQQRGVKMPPEIADAMK